MEIISIIPARGNSKSIPLKNLSKLNNKPLIYYSIKQSLNCKHIKRTIVSTDNLLIAKTAKRLGAEVPFLRPKKISQDHSRDIGFFRHLIKWLDEYENYKLEYVADIDYNSMILYPSHYWHSVYIKEDWFTDTDRVTFTGFFETTFSKTKKLGFG